MRGPYRIPLLLMCSVAPTPVPSMCLPAKPSHSQSLFGAHGSGWAAVVSAENVVGLVVALLLTVFLVAALLFPERF